MNLRHSSLRCTAILVGSLFLCAHGEGVRFDFGPADSAVAEGWTPVDETVMYGDGNTHGWLPRVAKKRPLPLYSRDENFSKESTFLRLGPVLRDHVIAGRNYSQYPAGGYTFRVDLPPGEHVGAVIMGIMTEKKATTINRPPFWWRNYTISVNGEETVSVDRGDLRRLLGDHYGLSERDFLPGSSMFDAYIRPRFSAHFFSVSGDHLELSAPTYCPMNALLVFPKEEEAELKNEISRVFEGEKEALDSQYTERGEIEEKEGNPKSSGGMVLFTRSMREIGPGARPSPEEAGRPIGEFVCPGETGILSFGLLPVRDLSAVSASVTDLVSEGGHTIPGDQLQIWLSKLEPVPTDRGGFFYRIRPAYAFPFVQADFVAGATRQLHLYVDVPEGLPAGDYTGAVALQQAGQSKGAALKVVVKVLPFTLPPVDMSMGMYWGNPMSTRLRHLWQQVKPPLETMRELCREIDEKAMQEMKRAGFTTAAFGPASPFKYEKDGTISTDEANWAIWCDRVEVYTRIFGKEPLPAYGIGWSGGLTNTRSAPGFWGREIDGWEKHGFTPEAILAAEKLCEHFYAEARKREWPEIIFYVQDEMANHGSRGGRMATERAKIFRRIADKVGFRTCASMNGPVEIPALPYLDIAIPNGALPVTEENLQRIKDDGCDLWFYNIGSKRFTFGYYLNKTRPKGRLQWSFGNTSRYMDQIPGLPSLSNIWYTLHWSADFQPARRNDVEEMRQGILDYRFFRLLEELILKAEAGNLKSCDAKGLADASRLRDDVMAGVLIRNRHSGEDFVSGVWSPRTCQRLRWRIVLSILALLGEGR